MIGSLWIPAGLCFRVIRYEVKVVWNTKNKGSESHLYFMVVIVNVCRGQSKGLKTFKSIRLFFTPNKSNPDQNYWILCAFLQNSGGPSYLKPFFLEFEPFATRVTFKLNIPKSSHRNYQHQAYSSSSKLSLN